MKKANLTPSALVGQLAELLGGEWRLEGDADGEIRFERSEGGFFLIQHIDLRVFGRQVRGMEIIGHLHRLNDRPSDEVWTRFYSFADGLTLDYVYELNGRVLTIWFMKKGSDNRYTGCFSEDGNSFEGAWAWPGGGYRVKGTRIK